MLDKAKKHMKAILSCLFILCYITQAMASPIWWDTSESQKRFLESKNDHFFRLVNFYQPQEDRFLCGIASAIMVMSAFYHFNTEIEKPVDPRYFSGDTMYGQDSQGTNFVFARFTQKGVAY